MTSVNTLLCKAILIILSLQTITLIPVATAAEQDGVEKTLYLCRAREGKIATVPDACPPGTTEVDRFRAIVEPGGAFTRVPANRAASALPNAQTALQESSGATKTPGSDDSLKNNPSRKTKGSALAGIVVIGLGTFIVLIAYIGFLIAAFKTGIGWGLACLIFGPVCLLFTLLHWDEAKPPFLLYLIGFGVVILGNVIAA
jgi:hypothetical protein